MFGSWPLRRWFRLLWCLLAAACLGFLPWLIIEFKQAGYSIHYQVCSQGQHSLLFSTSPRCTNSSIWSVRGHDLLSKWSLCEEIALWCTGMVHRRDFRAAGAACEHLRGSHAAGVLLQAQDADLCHQNSLDGSCVLSRLLACSAL